MGGSAGRARVGVGGRDGGRDVANSPRVRCHISTCAAEGEGGRCCPLDGRLPTGVPGRLRNGVAGRLRVPPLGGRLYAPLICAWRKRLPAAVAGAAAAGVVRCKDGGRSSRGVRGSAVTGTPSYFLPVWFSHCRTTAAVRTPADAPGNGVPPLGGRDRKGDDLAGVGRGVGP